MVNRMPVPLITEMEHKEEDVMPFDFPESNMLTPSRRRSSAMSQISVDLSPMSKKVDLLCFECAAFISKSISCSLRNIRNEILSS